MLPVIGTSLKVPAMHMNTITYAQQGIKSLLPGIIIYIVPQAGYGDTVSIPNPFVINFIGF